MGAFEATWDGQCNHKDRMDNAITKKNNIKNMIKSISGIGEIIAKTIKRNKGNCHI